MSYNIEFRVRVADTDKYTEVGWCDANITWNVHEIITRSTGLEWNNEANNGYCIDIIPSIQKGYNELCIHPDRYRQYEAGNGWGTVEGTKRFFRHILESWNSFAENADPEIVAVTTFWII